VVGKPDKGTGVGELAVDVSRCNVMHLTQSQFNRNLSGLTVTPDVAGDNKTTKAELKRSV
jgi:hypothetical protein